MLKLLIFGGLRERNETTVTVRTEEIACLHRRTHDIRELTGDLGNVVLLITALLATVENQLQKEVLWVPAAILPL
jgi:hypothetical protein